MPVARLAVLAALLLSGRAATNAAQSPADRDGVRQAVLDYVEGFYEGDSTRFIRSVRPEVDKFGFWHDQAGGYKGGPFTWAQFFNFARRVRAGQDKPPANAPKQIAVFDVQDQTASAKLTAYWGTDYFLLAKYDGKWMIRHVMWQAPPKA